MGAGGKFGHDPAEGSVQVRLTVNDTRQYPRARIFGITDDGGSGIVAAAFYAEYFHRRCPIEVKVAWH